MSDQPEIRNPKSEIARKAVIGLAGGIGSGKSTVAAEFAKLGCVVLDSDLDSHAVLDQPEVVATIRGWWGEDVLDAAGRPDRKKIGRRVFGQPAELKRLTDLIHPRVHELRQRTIAERSPDPSVLAFVLDAPLLFEAGVDAECDAIVFIDAPLAQRVGRVAASRGWSADELARRERNQMDLAEKRRRCGFVIRNDGDVTELSRQVRDVLDKVMKS